MRARIALLSLLVAGALLGGGLGTVSPANAVDLTFAPSTADQSVGAIALTGFAPTDVVLAGVGIPGAPTGTTFRFASTTGLTPAYGYAFTNTMTDVTFTGTVADVDAALATMLVSTGAATGPFTINVTASANITGVYYNALNDHYYKYVPGMTTWTIAQASSGVLTWYGAAGYLVTITDAAENTFVSDHTNAQNIWIGATDASTEGTWVWATGPEAGTPFWTGTSSGTTTPPFNYASWAPSEPNNNGGAEDFAVTNWRGTLGLWNDVVVNSNLNNGYLVEFSPPVGGYTGVSSTVLTAEVGTPARVPSAPRAVAATPGNGRAQVAWRVPLDPGTSAITRYRVTAQPGGASCVAIAPALSCTVTGLSNDTSYTFDVKARNATGWGPTAASTHVTPVAPTIDLGRGTRVPAGHLDRMRAPGTSTGIPAGSRLIPFIRYDGQSAFTKGRGTIVVRPDGSFVWSRKISKRRELTGYVVWHGHSSNRITWSTIR